MKYGFKTYKGKVYSFDPKPDDANFSMLIPEPPKTEEERKEFALFRLKHILDVHGIKFYETQSQQIN